MELGIRLCFMATVIILTLENLFVGAQTKPYRKSFVNPYPRFKAYHDGGNPGEPLFLTPLIEANNITEARQKAKVVNTRFLNVESYAGYLTVYKPFNSNLFFWYFPAEENSHYAPVVLWLQGGPGASSLFGLFNENGPFMFKCKKLHKRDYRWSLKHNLIYIDNPVGTGFSFTDSDDGFAKNEKQVGRDLYMAVSQLFKLFDFSATSGFWIAGESYAGKYIPALAYYVHHAQNSVSNNVVIPLKGVAIGNGFTDPVHQMNYGDYLYQMGLIDLKGQKQFLEAEVKGIDCIHNHNLTCAYNVFDGLFNMEASPNGSLFQRLTGYDTHFNYLRTKDDVADKHFGDFLQSSDIRHAIHVGNKTDVMDSVAVWVADILNYYKVCIYNGQLDVIVAYPLTLNYLQKLKFRGDAYYAIAERKIWKVGNEIAGYKKTAGNLLEVLVRNAGHMAPMDQPKWMFDLITSLTSGNI